MYKEKINIKKVVKFIDNEITVLEYAFEYKDGRKGLTGSTFEPITKAFYKNQMKLSSIEDRLRECVNDYERGYYKNPYKQWAKTLKEANEAEQVMFDTSSSKLWDYLREELNLNENEAYIFSCIGGGRCFKFGDKFTHNVELEKYLEYES